MKNNTVALLVGLVFSVGLAQSEMINPDRVLGFLDVFGDWDPALMFVLGGAVMVTVVTFHFILDRQHPLFDKQFYLPAKELLDRDLIVGAICFGVGWGLYGYCPGPALAALAYLESDTIIFVIAVIVGTLVARKWQHFSN